MEKSSKMLRNTEGNKIPEEYLYKKHGAVRIRSCRLNAKKMQEVLTALWGSHPNPSAFTNIGLPKDTYSRINKQVFSGENLVSVFSDEILEEMYKRAGNIRKSQMFPEILEANGILEITGVRDCRKFAEIIRDCVIPATKFTEDEFCKKFGISPNDIALSDDDTGAEPVDITVIMKMASVMPRQIAESVASWLLAANLCSKLPMTKRNFYKRIPVSNPVVKQNDAGKTPVRRVRRTALPKTAVLKHEEIVGKVSADMIADAARDLYIWGNDSKITRSEMGSLLARLPEIAESPSTMKFLKAYRLMSTSGKEETKTTLTAEEMHSVVRVLLKMY